MLVLAYFVSTLNCILLSLWGVMKANEVAQDEGRIQGSVRQGKTGRNVGVQGEMRLCWGSVRNWEQAFAVLRRLLPLAVMES